jgi:hypothetical protein
VIAGRHCGNLQRELRKATIGLRQRAGEDWDINDTEGRRNWGNYFASRNLGPRTKSHAVRSPLVRKLAKEAICPNFERFPCWRHEHAALPSQVPPDG